MEADNIDGKKEPKRLPVWACIPLFIVVLFIFIGLYGTLVSGGLSLVLGVEARHPGVVGYIFVEGSMLLANFKQNEYIHDYFTYRLFPFPKA